MRQQALPTVSVGFYFVTKGTSTGKQEKGLWDFVYSLTAFHLICHCSMNTRTDPNQKAGKHHLSHWLGTHFLLAGIFAVIVGGKKTLLEHMKQRGHHTRVQQVHKEMIQVYLAH